MIKNDLLFWSLSADEVAARLDTSLRGLSAQQVLERKHKYLKKSKSGFEKNILLFLSQFKSPLTLLLIFALLLSFILGEFINSSIIFCILIFSGVLGFIQERNAGKAVEKLRKLIQTRAKVKRNNEIFEIAINEVVQGDIVILQAGDTIPADALIIESKDLYVNEAVLTGESFPSEKKADILPEDVSLFERVNSVFKGTSVISGTATIIAVYTEKGTELGKIETEAGILIKETAFEKGIKHFGYMLMRIALVLAGTIIIINVSLNKPGLDSILFALSLSIGLTPEMLPAIVTITLSAGAKRLAGKKMIVKQLSSIQNLGAIDVLCADKTGTLTVGEVKIHSSTSADGQQSTLINKYAYLNAFFESGFLNPMDEAIRKQLKEDITGYSKIDEVPFDFIRMRLSIVVGLEDKHIMITKGALKNVTEVCSKVQLSDGTTYPIAGYSEKIHQEYENFSSRGFRTIGISYKDITGDPVINKDDESDMIFLGFISLYDPPKEGIVKVIEDLRNKKVKLKIITGDNILIAQNIAAQIGIPSHKVISGRELHKLNDDAIVSKADDIDIFAETEPSQKERIVRALQKKGHVVGYLGDGINDAPALKAADVGVSVNNAVDVAKESADMVLLEKELSVMSDGISEGRKTYLNTLKYIFITISANFGNMLSMAGASFLLPFLPLLPSQILLTNFLTDIPALSISSDNVDDELLQKPRRWDIRLIREFMFVFGLESSLFDFLTFGVLILIFHTSGEMFRTGWFIESVITEVLILLVIRTRRVFFKSPAGKPLIIASIAIIIVVLAIPYIPLFASLGFVPLPLNIISVICLIALLYALFGEISKKIIFNRLNY